MIRINLYSKEKKAAALRRNLFITGVLVALLAGSLSRAIENGTEADGKKGRESFPYVYGLTFSAFAEGDDPGNSLCSAVLVTPRLILTAAHCFEKGINLTGVSNNLRLDLNSENGTGYSDGISVDQSKAHPNYKTNKNPPDYMADLNRYAPIDIAYIRLSKDAPITDLPKVRLTETDEERKALALAEVIAVGYGSNYFNTGNPGQRRGVGTKRYGNLMLAMPGTGWFSIPGLPQNVLGGDSGGPLLHRGENGMEVLGLAHSMNGNIDSDGNGVYNYSVELTFMKKNLCWVVLDSGMPIPGVDCSGLTLKDLLENP